MARVEWEIVKHERLGKPAISTRYEERVIGCFKGLATRDARMVKKLMRPAGGNT